MAAQSLGGGQFSLSLPPLGVPGNYVLCVSVDGVVLNTTYLVQVLPAPPAASRPPASLLSQPRVAGGIAAAVVAVVALLLGTAVVAARRRGDTSWIVLRSELVLQDPPLVLGRGAFGLVLAGTYRNTEARGVPVLRCAPRGRMQDDAPLSASLVLSFTSVELTLCASPLPFRLR